MSKYKVVLGTLVLSLLLPGAASAQDPTTYGPPSPAVGAGPAPGDQPVPESARGPARLSEWIVGTDCDCCGPLGDHHPLKTELFVRSGFSFVFGDGQLADSLSNGWMIHGGGRVLCFNSTGDAAWTFEGGLSNIHNTSDNPTPQVLLLNTQVRDGQGGVINVPATTASVKGLNRTFVNAGFGREWYLLGSAAGTRHCDGALWRAGWDVGGRYGTAKLDLNEIRHRTDVIGGTYVAVHSDIDIPWGCCVFQVGIRGEWDYTWSDILQEQNHSDLSGINLLLNLGVRY